MINTNTNNTLAYTGKLEAKIINKNDNFSINFHNSGTKVLLDLIAKALVGENIASDIPRFLDIETKSVVSGEYQSVLVRLVPLTGAVYGSLAGASDNDGRCKFTAYLTSDLKNGLTTLNEPRIALRDKNKQVLAYIIDDSLNTLWQAIQDQTESILEWTLIFENK